MVVFNNVKEGIIGSEFTTCDRNWIDRLAEANKSYGAVLGGEVRILGEVKLCKGISASMIG